MVLRAGCHAPVETRTGRQHRRGRRSRARWSCPCVSISGCRIRFSIVVCRTRSRKAIRAASKWWTTPPESQDHGGGAAASESRRRCGGRHLGSCEAVTFTGGGRSGLDPSVITQAVLRRRKRDPAGDGMSEVKSRTERDHERQRHGETQRGSRGRKPLLIAARPTEAGPERRETTDPPIAPDVALKKHEPDEARSETESTGTGSGRRVVGRNRSDASRQSRESAGA